MKILIKIVFSLSISSAFGQFPESWLGHYSGSMRLSNADAPNDSLEVSLEIIELQTDSIWSYYMHYHHPKYGTIEKNYNIVRAAEGKGFIMDERNGILIQMSYMNDCFYEYFEVEGVLYSTTMRRISGGILFEIFGASNRPSLETESQPDENNTVYKVLSMKPTFAQSALLMPTE